ncbi:MAG TPA: hypothetical protein VK558_06375 [Patescibacteria group bacterium]|nr:hypothetical protein [Patescibacteria group bacterium]
MSADAAIREGNRLRDLGHVDAAIGAYRRCLAEQPDRDEARRNLLVALLSSTRLNADERFAEHLAFGERLAARAPAQMVPLANIADPNRRLRLGYLSSNFANHPVGRAIRPLFEHRDRQAFQIFCYAENEMLDPVGDHLRGLADGWRGTMGCSDSMVANMIRSDQIDILICLAGHLDRNRLAVCAHRSAPIQVSYHDAATSGLAAMDYLLTDRFLSPPHDTELFTERLIRLPSLMYMPFPDGALAPSPRQHGGKVVFGGFNSPAKTSPEILELWAALLRRVAESRLLLRWRDAYDDPVLCQDLRNFFSARGISADRLELRGRADGHPLNIYNDVDITLDSYPFSGSTVSLESLWMGVPVITWSGAGMVGRWSAALLNAVGLGHLVATDGADYIERAAALAAAEDFRDGLRLTLRDRVATSPLCYGPGKCRQVERLFRAIWRRWCLGQKFPAQSGRGIVNP